MHYVLHAQCSENYVKTSKYLKRERKNSQFWSKSTNDRDLRVSVRVSTLDNVCTTFCTHNAVKGAFERRNNTNGKEMTLNFGQYRRMIAICVCLSLFQRWEKRALRSARIMQ